MKTWNPKVFLKIITATIPTAHFNISCKDSNYHYKHLSIDIYNYHVEAAALSSTDLVTKPNDDEKLKCLETKPSRTFSTGKFSMLNITYNRARYIKIKEMLSSLSGKPTTKTLVSLCLRLYMIILIACTIGHLTNWFIYPFLRTI